MLYTVTGHGYLMYAIGDIVETYNGIRGRVFDRYRPTRYHSMRVVLDDGTEVPEHHIAKVWRNGYEDWKTIDQTP